MSLIIKKFIYSQKYSLVVLLIVQILSAFIAVLNPYILGKYIDNLNNVKSITYIYYFLLTFLIIYITTSIISYINTILLTKQKNKLFYTISNYILNYLVTSKYSNLNDIDPDYLTEQISTDTNIFVEFIFNIGLNLTITTIQILSIFIIVMTINTTVAFIFLLAIPIYILVYILYKKAIYSQYSLFRTSSSKLFSLKNEILSKIWFIKANSLYSEMDSRYKNGYQHYFNSALNYAKLNSSFNIIQNSITTLSQICMFAYCGIAIIHNQLGIGQFTILNNYYNLILTKIGYFLSLGSTYQQFNVAKSRLNELLSKVNESNGTKNIDSIDFITIKNLNFSYGSNLIFSNFSYHFKKGGIYKIEGSNGSGKSTLINLLLFIEQDYTGEITYNDINLKSLNILDIRKTKISIIDQKIIMLNDSIENNISIISPTIESIIFSETSFIHAQSSISNLSGGELKKISIIRSLLKNSDVIILDEPESNLDAISIDELVLYLKKISPLKIIIIISHSDIFNPIITETINF